MYFYLSSEHGGEMAFKKRLFNRVESDLGFTVKIRAIKGYVEYREGHRAATVPVHLTMGKFFVNVYSDTPVEWKPPHASEPVSEAKRMEILRNIVAALHFRKYPAELIEVKSRRER
jgi:hypothetical protein